MGWLEVGSRVGVEVVGSRVGRSVGRDVVGALVGISVGDGVGKEVGDVVGPNVGGIAQYVTNPHGDTPFHLRVTSPMAPSAPAITCTKVPVETRSLVIRSGIASGPE